MSLNDPLLPPPAPSRKPTATKRTRRPSPAASARILATGLATTAMLGLTTGYAFARKAQPVEGTQNPVGTPSVSDSGSQTEAPSAQPQPQTPNVVAPTPGDSTKQSIVTAPPVVEIPVPTIAPAQPGNNWDGGNNQPSNGSN